MKDGDTALMRAARYVKSPRIVTKLLNKKANLEAKNNVRDFVDDISVGLLEATLLPLTLYPQG